MLHKRLLAEGTFLVPISATIWVDQCPETTAIFSPETYVWCAVMGLFPWLKDRSDGPSEYVSLIDRELIFAAMVTWLQEGKLMKLVAGLSDTARREHLIRFSILWQYCRSGSYFR